MNSEILENILDKMKYILFYFYCALLFVLPISKAMVEIIAVVIIVLGCALCLIDYMSHRSLSYFKSKEEKQFVLLLGLYMVACTVPLFWSYDWELTLKAIFSKQLKGVLLCLFMMLCGTPIKKKSNYLIASVIGVSIVISTDALWQLVTGTDLLRHRVVVKSEITATFHNPNLLAAWCLLIYSFLGFCFFQYRKYVWGGVCFLALIPFFYMTNCRAAWVTFFIMTILGVLCSKSKRKWLFLSLFVLLCIVAIIIMQKIFLNLDGLESVRHRMALWKKGVLMARGNWFLGSGLNTYRSLAKEYVYEWMPKKTQLHYAHNSYLQMLVEIGIAGLLSFCMLLGYYFKVMTLYIVKHKDTGMLCLLLGMSAFLLHYNNCYYA